MGSAKFGSFWVLAVVMTKSFELALCFRFPFLRPSPGPLPVICALATIYYGACARKRTTAHSCVSIVEGKIGAGYHGRATNCRAEIKRYLNQLPALEFHNQAQAKLAPSPCVYILRYVYRQYPFYSTRLPHPRGLPIDGKGLHLHRCSTGENFCI